MSISNESGISTFWVKSRKSDGWVWSNEGFEIVYNGRYILRNADTFDYTNNDKANETLVTFPQDFTWVGGPPENINITQILLPNDILTNPEKYNSLSIVDNAGVTLIWAKARKGDGWVWSNDSATIESYKGYYIRAIKSEGFTGTRQFSWPQPGPPQSTVPDSSGSPTFVLSNLATPSAGWTSFKVSIDTTTLNPYEFYVGNDANIPHRASVDRNGDDETKYVESNSDSRRYQRIRSIELVFAGHVYLGDNTTNDVISKYTGAQQGDLGPDHDNMYVYCARTTVGEAKETRVMIVNAHNLITSTSGSLKIPNILFIEGTQTLDDIRGLVDWSKSYIGTTSIYKAKWNPMLQDGTTLAYELTKYTTSTGNTLRDFYWKKKDTAVGASSEHGLFLRYSIDDGNAIFPGGVSKESFTSTPGQGSRLMIDEYYLGNIDGNIEEY